MPTALLLYQQIAPLLAHFPADVGLVIEDLTTGAGLRHHADQRFLSASLIKLPILWALYEAMPTLTQRLPLRAADRVGGAGILHELDPGLQPTLRDLAVLMIVLSDNMATNMLINLLGFAAINQTIQALGMVHTALQRHLMDIESARQGRQNWITAGDMAAFFRQLHHSSQLDASSRLAMRYILQRQQYNNLLPALWPEGVIFAHKTGWQEGIQHDAGLLWPDTYPVIVVVLTQNLPSPQMGIQLCNQIGQLVYQTFAKVGKK